MGLTGGGIHPDRVNGAPDEFGNYAVENRVSLYDLNAMPRYYLGCDHKRLTHRFQGRGFRLTDVQGTRIDEILPRKQVHHPGTEEQVSSLLTGRNAETNRRILKSC